MTKPLPASPITPTIPLDSPGVQHGQLHLPYSRDDSAYGAILIPISVVANGNGPTVLLTGANHGDEYHGPLALTKLVNSIDVAEVTGRIIVVPFMNHPAFTGAARNSPIDGANLNRVFPGSPTGGVTQKIADYMTRYLLPISDAVLDIHDGGKTLEFLSMAASHVMDDKVAEARNWEAALAFGAPYVTKLVELDMLGMWDAVVENSGTPFLSTEISGGGTTRPSSMKVTVDGVRNVLQHWGVLAGDPTPATSVVLDIPENDAYLISEDEGLLEWLVELGDSVVAGQPVAQIYDTVKLGRTPIEVSATIDGLVAMRHFPGLIKRGDAIAMQARVA
ncbi:MAG: N-alpha-acetyl diaminobutyric acid deacetylase DoeB [Actinomycetia bacterium]|nr:N-alpha-acetyl diaminobutyric acid deacetylase DoeB [Actinomycetes bacterium]MCP4962888.1 N-alpha-acetyl diaminobutyric acid deacetylase DoeB [Actinomycetes bacterium]